MSENKMIEELLEVQEEKREKGATMVEYAIMVIVIFVLVFAGMKYLGGEVGSAYSKSGSIMKTGVTAMSDVEWSKTE